MKIYSKCHIYFRFVMHFGSLVFKPIHKIDAAFACNAEPGAELLTENLSENCYNQKIKGKTYGTMPLAHERSGLYQIP